MDPLCVTVMMAAAIAGGSDIDRRPGAAVLEDIGTVGTAGSFAYDVSPLGEVVGVLRDGAASTGFRWTPGGGLVTLPSLGAGLPAAARAIAPDGLVYGEGISAPTDFVPGLIFWSGGPGTELALPGPQVGASVLDAEAGLAVAGVRLGPPGVVQERAFRLSSGLQTLLADSPSGATGLAGPVTVGWARDADGLVRGRRWTSGQAARVLAGGDGAWSSASAVSSAGRIVGASRTPQGTRATAWDDPQAPIVIDVPGSTASTAWGVNGLGDVVGSAETPEGRVAFFWNDLGGAIDLNLLLAPEDRAVWRLTQARAINDARQIAGFGVYAGTAPPRLRAFRLTLPPALDCPADVVPDGELNVNDVIEFVNAFNAALPLADVSGDGAVNVNDIIDFVNAFNAGCP